MQGFLDTTRWVREDWPVLKNIENYPALEAILQGILPGLAMVLFLALLPPLLRAAERFGGAMSLGAVETVVVSKLFWFQVCFRRCKVPGFRNDCLSV